MPAPPNLQRIFDKKAKKVPRQSVMFVIGYKSTMSADLPGYAPNCGALPLLLPLSEMTWCIEYKISDI